MRISDNLSVAELQAAFRTAFPFLEMVFFKTGESAPVRGNCRVGELRTKGSSGLLVLDGDLTAVAIEQTMADIFGLKVRVDFHKNSSHYFVPSNKPLNYLNYHAMHLAEDVVII
jgi:hypothetical protein